LQKKRFLNDHLLINNDHCFQVDPGFPSFHGVVVAEGGGVWTYNL
jgi:hypothetical protein